MNDMLATIIPKSDQLNADDLTLGRTLIIKITNVDISMAEQPVAISFEGDNGKPYKPGKSMRRVLVNVWGPDAKVYVGRSLELYRDDGVQFGGMNVGGIRISRMSHLDGRRTMALTETKARRKPFTVEPLPVEVPAPKRQTVTEWLATLRLDLEAGDAETVAAILAREDVKKAATTLTGNGKKEFDFMIAAAVVRVKVAEPAPDGAAAATDEAGTLDL